MGIEQRPGKHTLRETLAPQRALPDLPAGLVSGVISVVISISSAVLIFSGLLAENNDTPSAIMD